MKAFESQSLYDKSKVYIQRGLENDTPEAQEEFQLWAALSLELLAKSTLAAVHPSLIAETDDESILAACGHVFNRENKPLRTIQANVVFRRLNLIIKGFTLDEKNWCTVITEKRNSELHSGELAFSLTKREEWLGKFWRSCEVVLSAQNKTLDDWLGKKNAKAAKSEIAKLHVEAEIKQRILKHKGRYKEQYPSKESRKAAHALSKTFNLHKEYSDDIDRVIRYKCPACECLALLGGRYWKEDESVDEDSGVVIIITYATEFLHCRICALQLEGRDELTAAKIPEDFDVEQEPDYDDYGND